MTVVDVSLNLCRVEQMIAPPNVLRAARELVGMKQVDAAEAAGISRRSLQRLETGERGWANAAVLLQTYYENKGVVFIRPANGDGWGLIDNSRGSDISSGMNGTADLS